MDGKVSVETGISTGADEAGNLLIGIFLFLAELVDIPHPVHRHAHR